MGSFSAIFIFIKAEKLPFQAIIGGGGSEFDTMINKIEKLNLSDNIIIKGVIPHDDVPSFFNNLDLFIFSSIRESESLGLVALEALACGVPIIAKRNGAIDEFVKNNHNGFIFENSVAHEITDKIIKYSNLDKTARLQMKKMAFESVRKYDAKMIAKNLCNTLKNL
jgi:glycosyltransferase involved in cell wall biosynthesis